MTIQVKSSVRKDKKELANNIAQKAEGAASKGQMEGVYEATRKLCNDRPKRVDMGKSREGKLLTKEMKYERDDRNTSWKC